MIEFQLFGYFGLSDGSAKDLRPRLLKSRAILAILAATPQHRRSRSWFQSVLWPDRQHNQALSSLRTALADIRRNLGPYSATLQTSHSDVSLDPSSFVTDLDISSFRPKANSGPFLDGLDIAHAEKFDDWVREMRTKIANAGSSLLPIPQSQRFHTPTGAPQIYVAAHQDATNSFTQMVCDSLIDSIIKSTDDLGLAEIVDGRGRGTCMADFEDAALKANCSIILASEAKESPNGVIARLTVVELESGRLIWSKCLTGRAGIDLEDPATIAVVAEYIDVMSTRLLRHFDWRDQDLPPRLLAAAGINYMFKLGSENFKAADALLKSAHEKEPRGRYLAWRAYLRTFLLGELDFSDRATTIEEGALYARKALEEEPHNSMVLALCAHVENMLHDNYEHACELSSRSLALNRCNPLAWASYGSAMSFLGKAEHGANITKVGAYLGERSQASFQLESWASAAAILAGDFVSARCHAERSHFDAPKFAPPMRFLSALYCHGGLYEEAKAVASKLRVREPNFTFDCLKEDGYPADSLRKGKLTEYLPDYEF